MGCFFVGQLTATNFIWSKKSKKPN